MAAIRLHPVTKKPSVYWYEPNGKKDRKQLRQKLMLQNIKNHRGKVTYQ